MLFVSLMQSFGFPAGKPAEAALRSAVSTAGQSVQVEGATEIIHPVKTPRQQKKDQPAAPIQTAEPQIQRRQAVTKKNAAAKVETKSVEPKPAAKSKAMAKEAVSVQVAAPAKSSKAEKPAVVSKKPAAPAAPVAVPVVVKAPVVVPEPPKPVKATRGRAKSSAVAVPTPQPLPSHAPDAAKATFSPISNRVMSVTVQSQARKDPKLANNWKSKPLDQLVDAEVLAMPDAEYMNDVQMAYFRAKLVKLKEDILSNAGETTEHLREDTVVVPDPADRATIEEEHALELRTRDRERKLLKKIEQSIARIDAGDYGYCDETGEPIGVGRLLARPTASLSLEAQQRRELKQKMFGD